MMHRGLQCTSLQSFCKARLRKAPWDFEVSHTCLWSSDFGVCAAALGVIVLLQLQRSSQLIDRETDAMLWSRPITGLWRQ